MKTEVFTTKHEVFTGYCIKPDVDLADLQKYGFKKAEPRSINQWWQCTLDVSFGSFYMQWSVELLVSKEDRKLILGYEDRNSITTALATIEQMNQDGILVWQLIPY